MCGVPFRLPFKSDSWLHRQLNTIQGHMFIDFLNHCAEIFVRDTFIAALSIWCLCKLETLIINLHLEVFIIIIVLYLVQYLESMLKFPVMINTGGTSEDDSHVSVTPT